jgi:hypothetical protein
VPRGSLDRYEQVAGRIVAQQTGGEARARDVLGAPDGTHDFDVHLPDQRVVALEVTSAADGPLEAQLRLAAREWKAPSLSYHWLIGIPKDGSIRMKALMTKIVPALEVLERHGIVRIGGPRRSERRWIPEGAGREVADAARAIFALGADRATRIAPPNVGDVALVLPMLHGAAGSNFDALNRLVTECAEAKAEKLAAAKGDERHLFVWMLPSMADAELAIATLPPPQDTPDLPDGIDAVWVATGPTHPNELYAKLWRIVPHEPWEDVGRGKRNTGHSGRPSIAQ